MVSSRVENCIRSPETVTFESTPLGPMCASVPECSGRAGPSTTPAQAQAQVQHHTHQPQSHRNCQRHCTQATGNPNAAEYMRTSAVCVPLNALPPHDFFYPGLNHPWLVQPFLKELHLQLFPKPQRLSLLTLYAHVRRDCNNTPSFKTPRMQGVVNGTRSTPDCTHTPAGNLQCCTVQSTHVSLARLCTSPCPCLFPCLFPSLPLPPNPPIQSPPCVLWLATPHKSHCSLQP